MMLRRSITLSEIGYKNSLHECMHATYACVSMIRPDMTRLHAHDDKDRFANPIENSSLCPCLRQTDLLSLYSPSLAAFARHSTRAQCCLQLCCQTLIAHYAVPPRARCRLLLLMLLQEGILWNR